MGVGTGRQSIMKLHERNDFVARKSLAIQEAVLKNAEGLTFAELVSILTAILASWARSQVREERGTDQP